MFTPPKNKPESRNWDDENKNELVPPSTTLVCTYENSCEEAESKQSDDLSDKPMDEEPIQTTSLYQPEESSIRQSKETSRMVVRELKDQEVTPMMPTQATQASSTKSPVVNEASRPVDPAINSSTIAHGQLKDYITKYQLSNLTVDEIQNEHPMHYTAIGKKILSALPAPYPAIFVKVACNNPLDLLSHNPLIEKAIDIIKVESSTADFYFNLGKVLGSLEGKGGNVQDELNEINKSLDMIFEILKRMSDVDKPQQATNTYDDALLGISSRLDAMGMILTLLVKEIRNHFKITAEE